MNGPIVRPESLADLDSIRAINRAAFGRLDEADLVDSLRQEGAVLLSLIAQRDAQPIGHLLFSRMWIETSTALIDAVALAPIAILPEFQRRGIGGQLIRAGLDLLASRGERTVIVLGHRDYYPRFGFSTERAANLASPFAKDSYMALELLPGSLKGVHGKVRYARAFGI